MGGRDPETQWSRALDGQSRMILFDIPMDHHVQRGRLPRYLRDRRFGYLLVIVWVTPDPRRGEREALASGEINVESLRLLELESVSPR